MVDMIRFLNANSYRLYKRLYTQNSVYNILNLENTMHKIILYTYNSMWNINKECFKFRSKLQKEQKKTMLIERKFVFMVSGVRYLYCKNVKIIDWHNNLQTNLFEIIQNFLNVQLWQKKKKKVDTLTRIVEKSYWHWTTGNKTYI